ncbi:hypothetical protein C7S17_0435 [Burkholderia thailandensis]|nr:hypothetical protein [Burkholderia thailandensis]
MAMQYGCLLRVCVPESCGRPLADNAAGTCRSGLRLIRND